MKNKLLYTSSEWTIDQIQTMWNVIDKIGREELGLDYYDPQIELVTFDQMIDAYSTVGMPITYQHWSFGKNFIMTEKSYKSGEQGLAYEMVINSNPAVAYCMENNSATMQALVLSHACCLTGETEFLTPIGWKRLDEYKEGDLVAQYNKSGQAEFVRPLKYVHNKGSQEFINFETQGIKQEVTLDHKMVLLDQYNNLTTMSAEELNRRQESKTRGYNGKFVTGFKLGFRSGLGISDDEIRLMVAIKADGSYEKGAKVPTVRFHLKKERKIARLEQLLESLGYTYTKRPTYDGRYSIRFKCPLGTISKRYYTEYEKSMWLTSAIQLHIIAEEVLHWDGCISTKSFSSEFLSDVEYIQYVWAATGKHTHIARGTRCWTVRYSEKPFKGISKHGRDNRKTKDVFEKTVHNNSYCFTVPSGMFIIRDNLKISVTGNCGHVHFFKNNYLFKDWTDADSILVYLKYSQQYVDKCIEEYGADEVESLIDACHGLQDYGVDTYHRPKRKTSKELLDKEINRLKVKEEKFKEELEIYPGFHTDKKIREAKAFSRTLNELIEDSAPEQYSYRRGYPEENILYFMEKMSPVLYNWEREVVRIIRNMAQYFYPQRLTKVMNEGFACAIHYTIMNTLYDKGYISEGNILEFIHSHTSVCCQRPMTPINPYSLGFSMFMDLKRICLEPTDEDREWFPDIAGSKDWISLWKDCVANYRDESFILQFLSPKVIRDLKLFNINFDSYALGGETHYEVTGTHRTEDIYEIRRLLSLQHSLDYYRPNIQVTEVDWSDRTLGLSFIREKGSYVKHLDPDAKANMWPLLQRLWGFTVTLTNEERK